MPLDQLTRLGSVRAINRWGTPVMHAQAQPVVDFGAGLQALLCDMFATNSAADGAGLAAPQVGADLAVFVYDCVDADWNRRVGMVCNPIVELPQGRDRRLETLDEGCLSLPGGYAPLARPDVAICTGQDNYGEPVEVHGTGTLARCLQHETDHLHGMVFADRLSARVRKQLYATHEQVAHHYPADWPVSAKQA